MFLSGPSWYSAAVKVFVDDKRPVPRGWQRVWRPDEVIKLLESGTVTDISLTHEVAGIGGIGDLILLWIERAIVNWSFVPPRITIHSSSSADRSSFVRARSQASCTRSSAL